METEITMAIAFLLEQVGPALKVMSEPLRMTMTECIEIAKQINSDTTHNLIAMCAPMAEQAILQ